MWRYSLDQVVRELLRQHGDVPLLAVDELAQGGRSVLWSPEFAIVDDHGEVELDIAVIIDGRVIIGEAKSNDMLAGGAKTNKKAAQRLVAAAQKLSADEIVLPVPQSGNRACVPPLMPLCRGGRAGQSPELMNWSKWAFARPCRAWTTPQLTGSATQPCKRPANYSRWANKRRSANLHARCRGVGDRLQPQRRWRQTAHRIRPR
jgi:hypothetical protein